MSAVNKPRLPSAQAVAVHECGHAVARLALNEMFDIGWPRVRSVSVLPDDECLGRVKMPARLFIQYADLMPVSAPLLRAVRFDIIETLAGPIAEMRHVSRRGLEGYLARHAGAAEILAMKEPSLDGGDVDDAALRMRFLMRHTPGDAAVTLVMLWEAAWELVETEWPSIRTVSRVVLAAGTMDGDRLEEAWRLSRPPEWRRRARQQKAGTAALSWAGELHPLGHTPISEEAA